MPGHIYRYLFRFFCQSLVIIRNGIILFPFLLGKSTSLRNALSFFGGEGNIMGPDTPPAAIVYRAAHTTIPIGE